MDRQKPRLYATLTDSHEKQVRHLIVFFLDGSRVTKLVQIIDGVETPILTGTEFETREKADSLLVEWSSQEGFRAPRRGYALEPLERTIALAQKMGFSTLYDPRARNPKWPNPNFTGEVPLSSWPGKTPKNGGGFAYGFDELKIYAQPTPPYNTPLVAPADNKELVAFLVKHKAILDTVGTYQEFLLAGN